MVTFCRSSGVKTLRGHFAWALIVYFATFEGLKALFVGALALFGIS